MPRDGLEQKESARLKVMHERRYNDVLLAVAVQVVDERRPVHAGADLRHPLQRNVRIALPPVHHFVPAGDRQTHVMSPRVDPT